MFELLIGGFILFIVAVGATIAYDKWKAGEAARAGAAAAEEAVRQARLKEIKDLNNQLGQQLAKAKKHVESAIQASKVTYKPKHQHEIDQEFIERFSQHMDQQQVDKDIQSLLKDNETIMNDANEDLNQLSKDLAEMCMQIQSPSKKRGF